MFTAWEVRQIAQAVPFMLAIILAPALGSYALLQCQRLWPKAVHKSPARSIAIFSGATGFYFGLMLFDLWIWGLLP